MHQFEMTPLIVSKIDSFNWHSHFDKQKYAKKRNVFMQLKNAIKWNALLYAYTIN